MESLIITLCAFLASLLTFYSGFGLGTILMPVVALFFPLPIAIALTAVVHLLHNLIKTGLLWSAINWKVAVRFGSAAGVAALIGAWILTKLSSLEPIHEYTLFSLHGKISILGLTIGVLLITFATLETVPKRWQIKNLIVGGMLSGFFGGLSGNQGAFRSVFLVNAIQEKKTFIATNAVIASVVDLLRLTIYSVGFSSLLSSVPNLFLGSAVGGSIAGIILGMFFLPKISMELIQKIIIVMLYLLGLLIGIGLI